MTVHARSILSFVLGLSSLMVAVQVPAATPSEGWKVIDTSQSYSELLSHLKEAVSESDLQVVFDVGPTEAAAKRGIDIPGNRVIGVFNNEFAVDILSLSVPAMIEAPIRFYVTEGEHGQATLSWIQPSHIYAPYADSADTATSAKKLREKSKELDLLFSEIAINATQVK
ncbi:DUF302 domain-containing protein [Pollutimonas sp. H1-120]|uniref:DUF302 domain-containing protein n=1 Tax=Pollutimonas sp. H1-120 TaxID=3148824 RepID=UPI003B51ABE4